MAHILDPHTKEYNKGIELLLISVWEYNKEKILELDTVKSMVGGIV